MHSVDFKIIKFRVSIIIIPDYEIDLEASVRTVFLDSDLAHSILESYFISHHEL